MATRFHNVKLSKGKEIVYDENLPFRCDPDVMDADIVGFMKLIRPTLVFDNIKHEYLRDLTIYEA